ncbi:GGDEF domain-containing protein [uncultured Clostridium sp.]|uniref:GGDEF domain-containing protein n=1 Tax=uncultured Clostridium sp. TaxID=59620 RepID=UPI0025EC20FB|nr:GGDEF domain-containing protein [uncultured Clostridium sp.]
MQLIKLQIVSLIFLVSLWNYYKKNRNLRTSYNLVYRICIINIFINIIFDVITVYTVNNLSTVPTLINSIAHKIFILTLDLSAFYLYLYISLYIRNTEKSKILIKNIIITIPIIVSCFFVIFGTVDYKYGDPTNYLYGTVANTIYVSILFYTIVMFGYCFKYRKIIERKVINGMLSAILAISAGGIIQMIFPTLLCSSATQTLVMYMLFFSFENPAEFIDKTTGILNQYAFFKVLNDKIFIHKRFFVVVAYVDEWDKKFKRSIISKLDNKLNYKFKTDLYKLFTGCFAVITYNEEAVKLFLLEMKDIVYDDNSIIIYKYPENIECQEMILKGIELLDNTSIENMIYIDKSTGIRNRNAYEDRMKLLNSGLESIKDLWGIIVDVNHLKRVNDNYGHLQGDHLIKMAANIIKEALKDQYKVYRIGGDEFAVFLDNYSGYNSKKIVNDIRKTQEKYNKNENIEIDFSIGYTNFKYHKDVYVQDMMKRADRNMYANKKRMHKNRQ